MDFSSHNPVTSNALNLAARNNDVQTVKRLLMKMNPNCTDNRGWTCLHEAADNDSYESLILILKHPLCRPLVETFEGHTALYLACKSRRSLKTIKALLEMVDDIANYCSLDNVTPLHIACCQGRSELIELLIQYGAMIDVQDFDGDTPLHNAVIEDQHEAIEILLHAGANPEVKNEPGDFTPFHLACSQGCIHNCKTLLPFVTEINQVTSTGDSALTLGVHGYNDDLIHFLLENGADPHMKNIFGEMSLDIALHVGFSSIYPTLLKVTDRDKINPNIILNACKPHYFKMEILEALLTHDLGPRFFDIYETFFITLEQIGDFRPSYLTNAPLNSYLNISEYIYTKSQQKFQDFFYLFLMRGACVDPIDINECPPLVYIHYCIHLNCFGGVFKILREQGCNVDYCSVTCKDRDKCIPDAFIASITADPSTILVMLPYSLSCEPEYLLQFAHDNGVLGRIGLSVQDELISMIFNENINGITAETIQYFVSPLKHLCRVKVRHVLRNRTGGVNNTNEYLKAINGLPVPTIIRNYLCYT